MFLRHAARSLCAAGLVATILRSGVALAEDDATVEMARARFREGVQFYDQRQYDKARLAFLQAYALKPHPSILLNLAQSELRGGRPGDAANHFTEYLRTNTEASEAERQEAELGLAASKSKVGEVSVASESGAQISVDGEEKGTSPLPGPLFIAAGTHTVEAKLGDKRASKSITVTPGQATNVSLSLKSGPPPAAAPPQAAQSEEEEKPAERAQTEEGAAEEAPAEAPEEATVSTGGRKPFFKWFAETPVAWIGGIIGVGGLGGGLTMALLSSKDYSNANSIQSDIKTQWETYDYPLIRSHPGGPESAPCSIDPRVTSFLHTDANSYAAACKNYKDAVDAGDSKKTLAIAFTALGGAAVVGTVVYYFVDDSASASATGRVPTFQARVVPVFGGGSSGLGVVGSF